MPERSSSRAWGLLVVGAVAAAGVVLVSIAVRPAWRRQAEPVVAAPDSTGIEPAASDVSIGPEVAPDTTVATPAADTASIPEPAPPSTDEMPQPEETLPPDNATRTFLADLRPIESVGMVVGRAGGPQTVQINGRSYEHSLRAQPAESGGTSQFTFSLQGRFARLQGIAGIADQPDAAEPRPSLAVRCCIYGDANLLWQSETLDGPGKSQAFDIAVRGLDIVALVVESDAPGTPPAVWADAALTAEKPSGDKNEASPGANR